MKYQYWVFIICFCCYCYVQPSGQVHKNAIPLSFTENLPEIKYYEVMPSVDSPLCVNNYSSSNSYAKQLRFACPIIINLNPDNSGQWEETPGGHVWRIGIQSQNAHSLYLTLRYFLLPGTNMFVYKPGYQELRGAYTYRNNNSARKLSISPVPGDRLIVELNAPLSQHSFGELEITKVYHDFRNVFKITSQQNHKSSIINNCNEDINCANGQFWQTEKRAVCKIISNGLMGTGTLLGNTSGSNTPYILTAYHLVNSPENATAAIFLFNYETKGCQEELTTKFQSLSGATIISTTDHQLDFTLMKPYEKPPPIYQPYYAGWDATNYTTGTHVSIHHPFGNYKQIAIEYHPLISEDIGKGFDSNSTWKVSHWELGTTELGSSGAPLFNEEHRLVGTLTGGRSTCGYPRDDYFTKFGVCWDTYSDSSNQLKYWLDSAQTGQLISDGYDPYGFNSEFCDTAWNFFSYDRIGISNAELQWGWISGHSSAGYTRFAERFEPAGILQINGVYLNVAKAVYKNPLAYIELKVWSGGSFPENEIYSQLLFLKDLQSNKVNYVPFDTVFKIREPFFVGYNIIYNTVSDTFALYHTLDRGPTSPSSMFLYRNNWYHSESQEALKIYASLGIGISECYGKSRKPFPVVLNIYPNPCTNFISFDMPGRINVHEVKCYDNNGRLMHVDFKQTENGNRLYFNLETGIYFLKIITTGGKPYIGRFVVIK